MPISRDHGTKDSWNGIYLAEISCQHPPSGIYEAFDTASRILALLSLHGPLISHPATHMFSPTFLQSLVLGILALTMSTMLQAKPLMFDPAACALDAGVGRRTNAERMRMGLPPLTPRVLYDATKVHGTPSFHWCFVACSYIHSLFPL